MENTETVHTISISLKPEKKVPRIAEDGVMRRLVKFLRIDEIVKLASVSKMTRNRMRKYLLQQMKIGYEDSKKNINKNFFNIMRHNFNKKLVKISAEDFNTLLQDQKHKFKPTIVPFFQGMQISDFKVGPKVTAVQFESGLLKVYSTEEFEKLNFAAAAFELKDVTRFETHGWCVMETRSKMLWFTSSGKDSKLTKPAPLSSFSSCMIESVDQWSSNYDTVTSVTKSKKGKGVLIRVVQNGVEEAKKEIEFEDEVIDLNLGKAKLYVVDKKERVHEYDLTNKFAHTLIQAPPVSRIFSNGLLSFAFKSNNKFKQIEEMTTADLGSWLEHINLRKFKDLITNNKITGKQIANYTRNNFEDLLGFPYDSPEVNHIFVSRNLLRCGYYDNPELLVLGYNGHGELGIVTGNNMITEPQQVPFALEDFTDDIAQLTISPANSFITTLKSRRFACLHSAGNVPEDPKEKAHAAGRSSDEETEGKPGKKAKGSKKAGKQASEKNTPAQHSGKAPKKFEKNRWVEITQTLSKLFPDLTVDQIDSTKSSVYLLVHDRILKDSDSGPDSHEKKELISTGDAIKKLQKDPKLKDLNFTVGIKHIRYGINEMPLEAYLKSEIQEHSVIYIRHADSMKILWNKTDYTDLLDDLDVLV